MGGPPITPKTNLAYLTKRILPQNEKDMPQNIIMMNHPQQQQQYLASLYQPRSTTAYHAASSNSSNLLGSATTPSDLIMTVSTPGLMQLIQQEESTSGSGSSSSCSTPKLQFPFMLYKLMEDVMDGESSDIVSWHPDGKSFRIHDREAFMQMVPKYFKLRKFRSFTRQLNMWNFIMHSSGMKRGEYEHPHFQRGRKDLLPLITRTQAPKKSRSSRMDISNKSTDMELYPIITPGSLDGTTATPPRSTVSIPVHHHGLLTCAYKEKTSSLDEAMGVLLRHEATLLDRAGTDLLPEQQDEDTDDKNTIAPFDWEEPLLQQQPEPNGGFLTKEDELTAKFLQGISRDLGALYKEKEEQQNNAMEQV